MSKCQTVGKIKDKLEELEKAKEVTRATFMAEKIGKSHAALTPLEETGNAEADPVVSKLKD